MSVLSIITYVLKFVNWLTSRLDREEFKAMGRNEVFVEQAAILDATLKRAQAEWAKVDATNVEDLRRELEN